LRWCGEKNERGQGGEIMLVRERKTQEKEGEKVFDAEREEGRRDWIG
jgi:hypothetical protein